MDHINLQNALLTRRQALALGGATGVGLNLGGLMRAQAADTNLGISAIKSCIVLFYYGGPSHLDTFDMKPNAPDNIRGPFKSIATSVPGIRISEHQPHTSKIMHHVSVIRSMHHTNRLHDSASTETLTGRQSPQGDREEFAPIPQFFPSLGSSVTYMRRDQDYEVHHAALPWIFRNVVNTPCQGGGFLGSAYDPFRIDGDASKLAFKAEMFNRPSDLSIARLKQRQNLLERLATEPSLNALPQSIELKQLYGKAIELMQSERVAKALRIEEESDETRERYGVYPDKPKVGRDVAGHQLRGQNVLLARRLVEAEVPFINVYDFRVQGQNWDSHNDNFNEHKDRLLPPADKAYAALIEDLEDRGLLETTLVIALGEFGRTPKINGNAGRDHWPDCYSVALAGGGTKGGFMYGESDRLGAYPISNAVTPADLAATIFWRFGINHHAEIHDHLNRPYRLADGEPIKDVFV